MNTESKIKIIERFDSYYSGINNKGAFLLTFNTFLIGGFIIGYNDIIASICCNWICAFNLIVGGLMILSIASMILTIFAIIPFLGYEKSDNKSNWFFNDIATSKKENYLKKMRSSTEDSNQNDLNIQIYYLAKGLRKKHFLVKIALICNLIEIFLLIPITILILI